MEHEQEQEKKCSFAEDEESGDDDDFVLEELPDTDEIEGDESDEQPYEAESEWMVLSEQHKPSTLAKVSRLTKSFTACCSWHLGPSS